ncbi:MAG: phosphotransferase [Bifidobacteriaceae bacterium]|jgi:CTP:phosphocholine cytidylyltransferase-like protein/thiamine kinase-like enzyme|nr:phosphotransferase [Bifidobacteriaceae bacterium]
MNLTALVCRALAEATGQGGKLTQRELASQLGVSLGKANQLVKQAVASGYVEPDRLRLSAAGHEYLDQYQVDNAIVLAAGFGSRFVPLTYETPKGLLKVHGEPMLERQLRQLHEAGITDITLVVGYMKERFEYLVDKFGVKLVFNPEYATKNNLASLHCVRDLLASTYILVADNWIEHNMFHRWEPDSWMSGLYFEGPTSEWVVTLGAKSRIKRLDIGGSDSWAVVGPVHFTREYSDRFRPLLENAYASPGTENWYFEDVIKASLDQLPIHLERMGTDGVREFESLAELRQFDHSYQEQTDSAIMGRIASALHISQSQIDQIEPLKNGLTNSSFRFSAAGQEFVYRMPQEGANEWIDRPGEAAVYQALAPFEVADQVVWFDPATGHRITRYFAGSRGLDAGRKEELDGGIALLAKVHGSGLTVAPRRDLLADIARLQALCESQDAIRFSDYDQVAALVGELAALDADQSAEPVLIHGDFTASNILMLADGSVRLIDWELAGMGDPMTDLASFAVAAGFDLARVDRLARLYLGRDPSSPERRRLYRAIALTAVINTLWAEYRQAMGEELGEYPLTMYRYTKDYGRLALGRAAHT